MTLSPVSQGLKVAYLSLDAIFCTLSHSLSTGEQQCSACLLQTRRASSIHDMLITATYTCKAIHPVLIKYNVNGMCHLVRLTSEHRFLRLKKSQ